jgi:hypothetical protein
VAATMLVRSDGVRRIPVGRASGARRLWASGTLALRRAGQTQEPEEVAAHDLGLLFRRRAAATTSACDCCSRNRAGSRSCPSLVWSCHDFIATATPPSLITGGLHRRPIAARAEGMAESPPSSQLQEFAADGIMLGSKRRFTTVRPESDGSMCGRIYYARKICTED